MLYKAICLALVAALLHGSLAAQDQTFQPPRQTVAQMQRVLRKAQEKDKAVRVILIKKIENQKKFSGKVSELSDAGFVVIDEKTRTTKTLAYADVREVRPKGISGGEKIATGVVIGGVFVLFIIIWQILHAH